MEKNIKLELLVGAFNKCTSLFSIYIPQSVKFISTDSFNGASNLNEAFFEVTEGWVGWNSITSGSWTIYSSEKFSDSENAAKILKGLRYENLKRE